MHQFAKVSYLHVQNKCIHCGGKKSVFQTPKGPICKACATKPKNSKIDKIINRKMGLKL